MEPPVPAPLLRESPDGAAPPRREHAAVAPEHRDRILDWRTELARLEPHLSQLPAAARGAVLELVERFVREDGELSWQPAARLHDAA